MVAKPPIIPSNPTTQSRYWLWFFCSLALVGVILVRSGVTVWVPCTFRTITGWPCGFCGGTRALRALAVFDLGTAFSFNPLVTCLGLGASVILLSELCGWSSWRRVWMWLPKPVRLVTPWVAFVANWFYVFQHGV